MPAPHPLSERRMSMKRLLDNAVSLFVVVVVLFLILPLPTFMLEDRKSVV